MLHNLVCFFFQSRLIVAQMSNTRCEIFNWLLVPTSITIVLSVYTRNALLELYLTYLLCVLSLVAHIHYGVCVVRMLFSLKKVPC